MLYIIVMHNIIISTVTIPDTWITWWWSSTTPPTYAYTGRTKEGVSVWYKKGILSACMHSVCSYTVLNLLSLYIPDTWIQWWWSSTTPPTYAYTRRTNCKEGISVWYKKGIIFACMHSAIITCQCSVTFILVIRMNLQPVGHHPLSQSNCHLLQGLSVHLWSTLLLTLSC